MSKFLCICNHGNCRSYAMARILKYSGQEAINVGMFYTSDMRAFIDWADYVIYMSERPSRIIKDYADDKFIDGNIGSDRWGNPFNKELETILVKFTEDLFARLKIDHVIGINQIQNSYG